ncbi:NACHT domain-containing NTPase [Actinoplanes sp. N902-109]|uniref:NACHT domain-containing protein n=1 Tax=Actinoplanes sp. (strain N902-109) TaxID=649831 RepID=UPI000329561C|nr:ATP-binding protein [Actinoplanes sp. N902-109]AGL17759.1 hypothetical protein L083_4249 [Actinoplanes sp. N902-109]
MPKALTYADAVQLLDGASPLVKAADNLLGGALSLATAGGSDLALSLFDAKAEAVRLGRVVTATIADSVRGLTRYNRSQRLQAAHGVLVVTAFFESLDQCLTGAGLTSPGFTREQQLALAAPADEPWLVALLTSAIPAPAPDRGYDRLLDELRQWCRGQSDPLLAHLTGLAVWDDADDRRRHALRELVTGHLPGDAVRRYDESVRRLSQDVPEFAIWLRQLDSRAAARGLEALAAALRAATSHRDPVRQRALLAAAYRAGLDRPVIGGDAGGLVLPSLGAAYIDPGYRVKPAGPGARPAEEEWWRDAEPRDDFAGFLATYLTTPQAADAPMVLLGHPGAGKSSLTRVLAGRLPAADFLVVRVPLRDVRAEADLQDQVEQALRSEIGETVSWATLAGDAGAAMPLLLLDGFDELLQVTGIHQSDYLHRVAAFQQREATLGRPVAVIVTSRIAVADRARLPAGALAVRLEPFDAARVGRWLAVWNGANAARLAAQGRRPLPQPVVDRFPALAGQPLLLLMLALYDAAGNALQHDEDTFDTGQLYERLLSEFAGREVRRTHPGASDAELAAFVEDELLRLSVVAFAMFHRVRLWATTEEIDRDLAGLGLRPAVTRDATFRTPITAGQELVGRFFFIQRAQANRDDQTLQTYEFLHATFGEYLVARLVAQAVGDAAARSQARTLRLGPADDDDLLQTLLAFTPLTARATVLPFVAAMLRRTAPVRDWLLDQLRAAVLRPRLAPRAYAPVDKRLDHRMATYSFNLALLTVACGEPVHAADLFRRAKDPASWLRDTALQWRAAVPSGMYLDALETLDVTRTWSPDGRRDLVLRAAQDAAWPTAEPLWSHKIGPGSEMAAWIEGSFSNYFDLTSTLRSMHLSGALSDDALRHAVEPLTTRLSPAVTTFAVHGRSDAESVAHSLVALWLASTLRDDSEQLLRAYERAVTAVEYALEPPQATHGAGGAGIAIVLGQLAQDAAGSRLPAAAVAGFLDRLVASHRFPECPGKAAAVECLLTLDSPVRAGTAKTLELFFEEWPPGLVLRFFAAEPERLRLVDAGRVLRRVAADGPSPAGADPALGAAFDAIRSAAGG